MLEEWRPIQGIDHYQVSNLGRVKSLSRTVPCGPKPGSREIPEVILKPFKAKGTGYLKIMVMRKKLSVHRLVGLAWCEGHFEGACIDHKNGDRTDNRAENLEWVTHSENARRSYGNGRENPFKGEFSARHPASKPVQSMCLKTGAIKDWPSGMDAVRFGYDSSCITRCCKGVSRHHKGRAWRYAPDGAWSYEASQ